LELADHVVRTVLDVVLTGEVYVMSYQNLLVML
jgi:hypothetical protein